eukprot:310983-Hanusia_phi.AAC.4
MSSSAMQVIPLPFLDGNPNIRITNDHPPLISVIDVIMSVCKKSRNHASKILKRLPQDVSGNIGTFKFPGQRQRNTPVCTIKRIIVIMQHLPGKAVSKNRASIIDCLQRHSYNAEVMDMALQQCIQRKVRKRSSYGYIYVVQQECAQGTNVLKVGRTIHLHQRLLQYGSKCTVYYLHRVTTKLLSYVEIKVIQDLRKSFNNVQGKEWFEADIDQLVNRVSQNVTRCLQRMK